VKGNVFSSKTPLYKFVPILQTKNDMRNKKLTKIYMYVHIPGVMEVHVINLNTNRTR
jgi:hypothetical protein